MSPSFVLQIAFYAVVFCFIAIRWRLVLRAAWNAKWILALVAIAVASSAWSQDPFFTLRRSIVLLATTVYGIYFGGRFTIPEQLRLLSWTFALVVFSSLFMVIVLPQYGVDHGVFFGAWQGAFTQKNVLARAMVLAALVFYFVRPPTVTLDSLDWHRGVTLSPRGISISNGSHRTYPHDSGPATVSGWPDLTLLFWSLSMSGIGTIVIALAFLIWTYQSQLLALVGTRPDANRTNGSMECGTGFHLAAPMVGLRVRRLLGGNARCHPLQSS